MRLPREGAVVTVIVFECPRCAYTCDAATAVTGDAQPQPGDLSLCLHCGAPLEFAADMSPRWLTYEEVGRLTRDQRAQIVQALIGIVTMRPALTERVTWRLAR